jgi:hypothetical protein
MALELLAQGVALPLDRFAVRGIEPGEVDDSPFDLRDDGKGGVEIARLAGAIRLVAIIVRKLRL